MAASLLQLLRMRTVKSGTWGVLRSPLVSSLCTQTEDPAKPAKKTASKTAEAPDERATLLAYKTPVVFPVRFSKPGVILVQFPGVADQVAGFTDTAETEIAAPASTSDLSAADVSANNKSGDSDNGSSSSSDSDSDSDSDDEKSEVEAENKSSPPNLSGPAMKKEAKFHKITRKLNLNGKQNTPFCVSETVPEATPAATATTVEAVQSSMKELHVSFETLVNSAPENCVTSSETTSTDVLDAQTQTPAKAVTEPTTSENAPGDVPIETTHPTLDVASTEDEAASTEVTDENATEISTPVDSAEVLVDRAPVITEAVEEKLQAESEVEPPEEAAAAPPPEPEEPFDNSTYKNYQHHSYNLYTFVDQDVEMAKFRLPQPSSGRPSPRH